MASSSVTSTVTSSFSSTFPLKSLTHIPSPSLISYPHSCGPFSKQIKLFHNHQKRDSGLSIKAGFSDWSLEGVFGVGEDDPPTPPGPVISAVEDKEEPQCPPGLRRYETMAVLRPDMSEDERLALTQKYEELLVAGGGMYVEVFNRGVIPLAYSIRKKNKAGESNTYLDGIYLLFTYFTRPDSMAVLETTLKTDDNVIRSCSFKVRKRKY